VEKADAWKTEEGDNFFKWVLGVGVDRTGPGSCSVAAFGIGGGESSISITRDLVTYLVS